MSSGAGEVCGPWAGSGPSAPGPVWSPRRQSGGCAMSSAPTIAPARANQVAFQEGLAAVGVPRKRQPPVSYRLLEPADRRP